MQLHLITPLLSVGFWENAEKRTEIMHIRVNFVYASKKLSTVAVMWFFCFRKYRFKFKVVRSSAVILVPKMHTHSHRERHRHVCTDSKVLTASCETTKGSQRRRRYEKMLQLILDYSIWLATAGPFIFWERTVTFMAGRRPSKGLRAWQATETGTEARTTLELPA